MKRARMQKWLFLHRELDGADREFKKAHGAVGSMIGPSTERQRLLDA